MTRCFAERRGLRGLGRFTALALGVSLAMPVGAQAAERRERREGDGMVYAGVGVTVAGIAGIGLMGAGLGIGNRAEQDLAAAQRREDLDERRALLDRGAVGNRLAIAGAVTAAVGLAVGITLIFVGRRRHQASLSMHPGPGSVTVRVRF